MFAKLFGPEDDQILVKFDRNENEEPEVRIFFTVPSAEETGVCSLGFSYKNDDKGWDNAEKAFAKMDEAYSRELVSKAANVYLQHKD